MKLKPDVVVVLTDTLGTYSDADRRDVEENLPELRLTYADPLAEMPRWSMTRPVIGISIDSLGRGFHPPTARELPDAGDLLRRIAQESGGRYVAGGRP